MSLFNTILIRENVLKSKDQIIVCVFYFLYPCIMERILGILAKRFCCFHMTLLHN